MFSKSAIWDKGFVLLWSPLSGDQITAKLHHNTVPIPWYFRGNTVDTHRGSFLLQWWMAAGFWKAFQGSAGGQNATSHNSTELIPCARHQRAASSRSEMGKGMGGNQRSRTGSNRGWSRFCQEAAETWIAKETYRASRRRDKSHAESSEGWGCAAPQQSEELELSSQACPVHLHRLQGSVQPALLTWNRRSLNLSAPGNGYLTNFFKP